jgi:hypothetical protein
MMCQQLPRKAAIIVAIRGPIRHSKFVCEPPILLAGKIQAPRRRKNLNLRVIRIPGVF